MVESQVLAMGASITPSGELDLRPQPDNICVWHGYGTISDRMQALRCVPGQYQQAGGSRSRRLMAR